MTTVASRRLRTAALLLVLAAPAVAAGPAAAAAPPKRVVALTPFTANTLAGLGVKPVAIGQTLGGNERFDAALRDAKVLPLSHPNGPNMEQLAALRPQLVFSSPTWRKGGQTMRRLDMRVEEADPTRLRDVGSAVARIGKLVGRERQARTLAKRLKDGIARATRGIEHRPRVLMVLGVGRTPFAFLPNSWGGDLVTRAGGKLVTAGAKAAGGFARISDEKVVEADPDIILAVPHANPDDLDDIKETMESNELWKLTAAGENRRIYVSMDNSLLQAGTDVARVIRTVRRQYLKNW
jgi:ABC-type Fe3+-hydroxamate transport system substrate-binding protein